MAADKPVVLLAPVAPTPTIPKELVEQITGCRVETYLIEDGSKPGDNWMSVIYSVTANLLVAGAGGEEKETRHLLFKCYPQHPGRQVYLNKTNMFHKELSFYSVWGKSLVDFQTTVLNMPKEDVIMPAFPQYIGGKAVDFRRETEVEEGKVYRPTDIFIVLEDLRRACGYQMMERAKGLEFDHIALTVNELATIHALSWAYQQRVEPDLVGKFPFLHVLLDQEDQVMWGKIVQENVQIAVKTMDDALGSGNCLSESTLKFSDKVGKVIELFLDQKEDAERESWSLHRHPPQEMVTASENEVLWRVICHGDTWCNNLLFKMNLVTGVPEKVKMVDFQLARNGCPTADLVYLLYTSTTVHFRREYLSQVLQMYCDKFQEMCGNLKVDLLPEFSIDVLQRRFHRAKVVGYMMAVTTFPMMLKEERKGGQTNLEQVEKTRNMEDMFIEAFSEGAGESSLYKTRILEIARELYDEGVI